MCFIFIWEQTATYATYSINWLVFITEMKSVYSAVRAGSLNKAVCALSLKGLLKPNLCHSIFIPIHGPCFGFKCMFIDKSKIYEIIKFPNEKTFALWYLGLWKLEFKFSSLWKCERVYENTLCPYLDDCTVKMKMCLELQLSVDEHLFLSYFLIQVLITCRVVFPNFLSYKIDIGKISILMQDFSMLNEP